MSLMTLWDVTEKLLMKTVYTSCKRS